MRRTVDRLGVPRDLPILCGKPRATDLSGARELVRAVSGIRLMVRGNSRLRRYYRDAAARIRQSRTGGVRQCPLSHIAAGLVPDVKANLSTLTGQPFVATPGRLPVSEVLIHQLDTLPTLSGELTVVAARLGRVCPSVAGEDNAMITLRASAAAAVPLIGNPCAHGFPSALGDELPVLDSLGSISLSGNVLACHGRWPARQEHDMAACYWDSYTSAITHFAEALGSGAAFETSPGDNLRTLRLVEDSYCPAGRA